MRCSLHRGYSSPYSTAFSKLWVNSRSPYYLEQYVVCTPAVQLVNRTEVARSACCIRNPSVRALSAPLLQTINHLGAHQVQEENQIQQQHRNHLDLMKANQRVRRIAHR